MNQERIFSLEGKKALISGAGRGIGFAIAEGFVKSGCDVGIFDKNFPQTSNEKIKSFKLDLSISEQIKSAFEDFYDSFESIDILVNCAGITIPNPAENYISEDWFATMDINLNAIFYLTQLAGNKMIQQNSGGSIINLTSIGAEQGFPNNPAYCASKGGLKQLTKALAYDWGKYGIRVNNLVPGYTNTPMNKKSWNDQSLRKKRAGSTVLNRWAEPEEMVGPAVFLASDASSYVTASDLVVDGGWIAKGL